MAIQLSGSLALSGSINATGNITSVGTQQIVDTSNATSFTSTASLYTDGGARIGKDLYVSGTTYLKNLTVYGTQSVNYITSSQLDISDNVITVNTFTPAIRYGGLGVYDSGSTGLSGSMLWDSEQNRWIYSNPSGSSYDGGMIMSGPRNTSGLGNEQGTLANYITKGQGGDHITSSRITEDGNLTSIYSTMYVTSSGNVGIGVSTPSGSLHVLGSTYAGSRIYLQRTSGALGTYSMGVLSANNCFGIVDEAQGNLTRLYIDNSGNVGIGTTTPKYNGYGAGSTTLTVQAASGDNIGILELGGTRDIGGNQNGIIMFYNKFGTTTETARIFGTNTATSNTAGELAFSTKTTGGTLTEAMRINASGSVGIGTTSPQCKLDVQGNGGTINVLDNASLAANVGGKINFQGTYNSSGGFTDGGSIKVGKDNATDGVYGFYMAFNTTQNGVGGVERMRITSSGTVYINANSNPMTGNATPQLGIIGSSGTDALSIKSLTSGNNMFNLWSVGTTGNNAVAFYKGDTQTLVGTISITTSATSYNTSSDYRLKTNVIPLKDGIERLMKLKPSKFTWIVSGEDAEGFIAHEVQEVFPDAVTGEKDAVYQSTGNIKPQAVDYGRITPLLVKAIQEQQAQIELLKAEIEALKAK
jgi:hypothetical protein